MLTLVLIAMKMLITIVVVVIFLCGDYACGGHIRENGDSAADNGDGVVDREEYQQMVEDMAKLRAQKDKEKNTYTRSDGFWLNGQKSGFARVIV